MYEHLTPAQAPLVVVEWLDITGGARELTRRWSCGFLMSNEHDSEGTPCVLLAGTWDEDDGWSDYNTFLSSVVRDIQYVTGEE